MSSEKYEGAIGSYSFIMNDRDTIEVWNDPSDEFPSSYIYLGEGTIKSRKDFDYEIMAWYSDNVG